MTEKATPGLKCLNLLPRVALSSPLDQVMTLPELPFFWTAGSP